MRKITKLLTLALAAMMIIGMIPFAASAAFEDVSYDDEALYEAVELLSTLGVAKGTSETKFSPEENVTRQQMAAFVYRLMKAGRSSEGGVNTTPFTDLEDSTFFNMISWASNAGVIKGTSATTFNPKGGITLQDAYVMLVRALGYENDGPLSYPFGYTDKAEELGLDENIASDVDYTTTLNRGQVAILLANAFYADMNETTVEYEWVTNGQTDAYVPVETTETIAHKIFGVEEETFVVLGTTHYGIDNVTATYDELNDVELITGTRYDNDGNVIATGVDFELEELGLDGDADEYFLAELTLFVKKDAKDVADDEVIAAKSNLVKKTITAADVKIATSTKTDKEYYVGGVKKADGDKVMTGIVEFGGISAYLDYDQAPYSYKKDYAAEDGIKFIDLETGSYDEDNATFAFVDTGISFQGAYVQSNNGSYDNLTVEFEEEFPLIYNEGLYEADVYDSNGDGYVDYLFIKDYTFVEIVDKKNKPFKGLQNFNSADYYSIYTEDATVEGDYKSGDFVLAYVNDGAKYVKVAETIAPIEAMVSARSSSDDSKTVTFKSGEVVEFVGAADKYINYINAPSYADFKAGKTYKAYIKGDVLLHKDGVSSGDFDADANYAIVLPYDEDPVTKYVVSGEGAEKITDERIVYSATGVVNGEFVTYFYVNAVIDGAVKAVQLADYANTFVSYDGAYELLEEIDNQKITDKEVAETVMYNDFLNKFSTYTVDSDGAYTFTAIDFAGADEAATIFADKDEEGAVYLAAASASIKNFTGSIYNVTGIEGISKFTLKDYSKLIIKTVDDEGEDVYTVYTAKTLPDFAETTFTNVMSVFVNNTASSYENLGILYAEIDEFKSDVTYDYRIVISAKTIADDEGKEKNIYTVLNITNAATAGDIETVKGLAAPANGKFVLMNEEGKIAEEVSFGSTYVEDKMFKATFNGGYEEANKFLEIGDGNTYVITDDTTFLYYTSPSVYQMADDDILTVEDNSYEGLEEAASFTLYIVADEIDDKNTDDTIKTVKSIIVTK